jgi:hypothetical protein
MDPTMALFCKTKSRDNSLVRLPLKELFHENFFSLPIKQIKILKA